MPEAIHIGTATLHGYTVVARAYADVDETVGGVVHGVLFRIGPRELGALDRYEGYPTVYRRIRRTVFFKGQRKTAMIYEMTPETKRSRGGHRYAEHYRLACSEGARQHGIPDAFRR